MTKNEKERYKLVIIYIIYKWHFQMHFTLVLWTLMYISLFLYFKNNIVWLITTIDLLKMGTESASNVVCLIRVLCLLLKVEFIFWLCSRPQSAANSSPLKAEDASSYGSCWWGESWEMSKHLLHTNRSLRLIDTQVMIETSFLHTINIIIFFTVVLP